MICPKCGRRPGKHPLVVIAALGVLCYGCYLVSIDQAVGWLLIVLWFICA